MEGLAIWSHVGRIGSQLQLSVPVNRRAAEVLDSQVDDLPVLESDPSFGCGFWIFPAARCEPSQLG